MLTKMDKDKALWWLSRRIKELDAKCTPPSHEDMEKAGIPYERRAQHVADAAKLAEGNREELESLRKVCAHIEETVR